MQMKNKIRIFSALSIIILLISCDKDLSNRSFDYEDCDSGLENAVTTVFFIDEKSGYAAGNGNVFRTGDGGMTWDMQTITDLPIYDIFFLDDHTGFLIGGLPYCLGPACKVPGSIVFGTTDAGENWTKLDIPYSWSELKDLTFLNEKVGFATGLGLHLKTVDGGVSWQEFSLPYKGVMNKVLFTSENNGYIGGLFGNIYMTSNQGESWTKSDNKSDGHIYDMFFLDQKVGFAAGQKEMVKTTDGGNTWELIPDSPFGIYFLHFSNSLDGIALGNGILVQTGEFHSSLPNAIYRTRDGGKTWEIENDVPFASAASFYSDDFGYAVVPKKTFKLKFE